MKIYDKLFLWVFGILFFLVIGGIITSKFFIDIVEAPSKIPASLELNLPEFNHIDVQEGFSVFLSQSKKTKVVISGSSNVITKYLVVKVVEDTLKVSYKPEWKYFRNGTIATIECPNLESVSIENKSYLSILNFPTSKLYVDIGDNVDAHFVNSEIDSIYIKTTSNARLMADKFNYADLNTADESVIIITKKVDFLVGVIKDSSTIICPENSTTKIKLFDQAQIEPYSYKFRSTSIYSPFELGAKKSQIEKIIKLSRMKILHISSVIDNYEILTVSRDEDTQIKKSWSLYFYKGRLESIKEYNNQDLREYFSIIKKVESSLRSRYGEPQNVLGSTLIWYIFDENKQLKQNVIFKREGAYNGFFSPNYSIELVYWGLRGKGIPPHISSIPSSFITERLEFWQLRR